MATTARTSSRNVKLKVCQNTICTNDDRLSELPDEILVCILSLLTVREAVLTSILSKRWKHLWKFINQLDFGDSKSYGQLHCAAYVQLVNHALGLHKGHTLERFRICFQLNLCFKDDIDNWIKFALSSNVRVLELSMVMISHKSYSLSTELLGPGLVYPCGPVGAKCLKEMHLSFMDVSDEDLGHILSYCPMLEHLSITCSRKLVNVTVSGASLMLKSLELCCCFFTKTINIQDVNLVSLTYVGSLAKLRIKNVPALVDLKIGGLLGKYLNRVIPQLSGCLSQLKTFTLDVHSLCIDRRINVALKLTSLKEFMLKFYTTGNSLLRLMALVKASPHLRKFVLQSLHSRDMKTEEVNEVVRSPHYYLREVLFLGYCGCTTELEIVKYLFECAVALEKITIDTHDQWVFGHNFSKNTESTERERAARMRAKQQLEGIRPVGVKLEII